MTWFFEGGRVLDPETGLDGVRNVGITGGKVARISADALFFGASCEAFTKSVL